MVKSDKVGSLSVNKANKTDEISAKSKLIRNMSKVKNWQRPNVQKNLPSQVPKLVVYFSQKIIFINIFWLLLKYYLGV